MSLIRKWMKIVFTSLYFSVAVTAHANSLIIQTEFWEHQLTQDLFHASRGIKNLNLGFVFGVDKEYPPRPLRDSTIVSAEELKKEYEITIGSWKKQNKRLNEEKERIKEMILQENFGTHEKKKVVSEIHENEKIPVALSFDWHQFYECTQETLPFIKELIQREVQMENLSPEDQAFIRASVFETRKTVQQNRGDGSQGGNLQGVACGKFLGAAGFAIGSLIEDAKILAAISSREEEEARLLTKALVASHHLDFARENPEAFQQWKYFWNELSVKAVFSKDPLPLLGVYEELRVGDLGTMSRALISKYTQEGLVFADGKLR